MTFLSKHCLILLGLILNSGFYTGALPFRWNKSTKTLYLPQRPNLYLIPWYLSCCSLATTSTFLSIKLLAIVCSTKLKLVESFILAIPIIFLAWTTLFQLGTIWKSKEILHVMNQFFGLINKYEALFSNNNNKSSRHGQPPEYFILLIIIVCIQSTMGQTLVSILLHDPRIGLVAFITASLDDFNQNWDLVIYSSNTFQSICLTIGIIILIIQSCFVGITYFSFLILICSIIPNLLAELNTFGFSHHSCPNDLNLIYCKLLYKFYRSLFILVGRISVIFKLTNPLIVGLLAFYSMLFSSVFIQFNKILSSIQLSNHKMAQLSAVQLNLLETTFYSICILVFNASILLLRLIISNLASFSTMSTHVLVNLKYQGTLSKNKLLSYLIRSCRVLRFPIGAFGYISNMSFLIVLRLIFDISITLVLFK